VTAEAIYNDTKRTGTDRAMAADFVAAYYLQDSLYQDALDWARKSYALRPTSTRQNFISQLQQKVGP